MIVAKDREGHWALYDPKPLGNIYVVYLEREKGDLCLGLYAAPLANYACKTAAWCGGFPQSEVANMRAMYVKNPPALPEDVVCYRDMLEANEALKDLKREP